MNNHYHGTSHMKTNCDRFFEVRCSDMRSELVAGLRVARILVRVGDECMVRKGNYKIVECKNQLTLLDAIDFGFIKPVQKAEEA